MRSRAPVNTGGDPMGRIRSAIVVHLICFGLFYPPAWGAELQLSARVDSTRLTLDDQLEYTVEVRGEGVGEVGAPRLGHLEGFEIVSQHESSRYSFFNGRVESSRAFSYILLPTKTGLFTLEPAKVEYKGRVISTESIRVRVAPGSSVRQPRQPPASIDPTFPGGSAEESETTEENDIFVLPQVDEQEVVPGQQVTLSYYLLTRRRISRIRVQQEPDYEGFWVEELDIPENPAPVRRRYQGREYKAYLLQKKLLFPVTTGSLTIGSLTLAIDVVAENTDLFRSFFFDRTEQMYRRSPPEFIEVVPFAHGGRPPGFEGAVGEFHLTSDLLDGSASVGNPMPLQVSLTGWGNLRQVTEPRFEESNAFTLLEPKRAEEIAYNGTHVEGTIQWEYLLIPRRPGPQETPVVSLAYFNPEQKLYKTVRAGSHQVAVYGTPEEEEREQAAVKPLKEDIHYIKLDAGGFRNRNHALYGSPWSIILFGVPLLANAAYFLYLKRIEQRAQKLPRLRQKQAKRRAIAALDQLERRQVDGQRFYEELSNLLLQFIGDKFDRKPQGLSEREITALLVDHGVSDLLIGRLLNCLSECDRAKFTPQLEDFPHQNKLLQQSRIAIRDLSRSL